MNIPFLKKDVDKEKKTPTVVCSNDFIQENIYIQQNCEKDLQNILDLVDVIIKGEIIRENRYKILIQSIDILLEKLKDGDYKEFIKSIKSILSNTDYYIISVPSSTESGYYIPKKFFQDFIKQTYPYLSFLLKNNIDDIDKIKENISNYNTIINITDFENKKNEWNTLRQKLDNLCEELNKTNETETNCSKIIDIEKIKENIEKLELEKKQIEQQTKKEQSMSKQDIVDEISIQLPPPPPPPNIEQSKQQVSPDEILKKYVETFKTIYLHPFFYQIASLDIKDFVSLFDPNSENIITIDYYEDNIKKTYDHKELFNVLFNFIYVDVTPFYNLIQNKEDNPQLDVLINSVEKLTDKILFDTDKANNIKLKNNEIKDKKYLFIKNFYEIIEKTITLDYLDINYIFVYFISLVREQIKNTIKLYKILNPINERENKDAYKKLENILSKKSSDMVLTFLKINNFEGDKLKTNQRFNIDNDSLKENKLILGYNDDNIIYYDTKDRQHIKTNINAVSTLNSYGYNIIQKTEYFDMGVNYKYKNKYHLGPFSKIFNFNLSNEEISKQLDSVQNLLENQIPVFILGYGASGAGKTSSLIYNKNDEQNGIIVHLCNIMGRKNIYNKVELKSREFYAERLNLQEKNNGNKNTIVREIPENNNVISFEYKDDEFKLTQDYTHTNKHVHLKNGENKIFKKDTKIGKILEYIIDNDRLVFATTNNPNSSRSHSLSFLKFTGNGKEVTLIVGDFAGVENIFNCDDGNTIDKFKEIKNGEKNYYDQVVDEKADEIRKEQKKIFENKEYQTYKMNVIEKNTEIMSLYNKLISGDKITKFNLYTGITDKPEIVIQNSIKNNINSLKIKNIDEFESNFESNFKINFKSFTKSKETVKFYIDTIFPIYVRLKEQEENKKIEENKKQKEKKINDNYIFNICRLRRNEGYMINNSLEEVRKVIKYILIYKNKDRINISPPFIKECIDFYCSKDKCFPIDRTSQYDFEKQLPEYSIFREIYDNLGKDNFLKIVISVFCVLNISRVANNPPPIPYIDINILKKLYYNPPNNSYDKLSEEFKHFFEKDTNDKFKNPPLSYFETNFLNVNDQNIFSKDAVNNVKTLFKNKDFIDVQTSISYITENDKTRIENFFNLINKFNASSAIGTLDFLDQLAKFNTINSICKLDKLNL